MDKTKWKKSSSQNLFIVGSSTKKDFPADYVSQTVRLLAKKNKVIVFYWGTALSLKEYIFQKKPIKLIERDVNANIIHYYPIHYLPFKKFSVVSNINLFVNVIEIKLLIFLKGWNNYRKFVWNFCHGLYNFPKYLGKYWNSLYDCVEYPFSWNKKHNAKIYSEVRKIIINSKYFIVDSPTLKMKFAKYKPVLVPQGFDLKTFKENNKFSTKNMLFDNKKPVIGYIGGINYRLNFKLIADLIKRNPQWNYVFIGPKQKWPIEDKYIKTNYWIKKISKYKNFIYVPDQPKKVIPTIINQFDVCLIPYDVKNKFNYYSRAMKTYEYFYLGKPIISTPTLESVRLNSLVFIADNSIEFERLIKKLLKSGISKEHVNKQKLLAINNSWFNKIKEISNYVKLFEI
ncbi:MAG: hypothetical protein ABIJ05_00485 [Patescibacteria group bacterium]